jgi:hypothetical protein
MPKIAKAAGKGPPATGKPSKKAAVKDLAKQSKAVGGKKTSIKR